MNHVWAVTLTQAETNSWHASQSAKDQIIRIARLGAEKAKVRRFRVRDYRRQVLLESDIDAPEHQ